MNVSSLKNHRIFIAFVIITSITAWFSIGFYQVDEHFQILEFGGFKAGWFGSRDLPWEFRAQMRSSVEPYLVVLFIKLLELFNYRDPFLVTFFMRLTTAALCTACYALWRNRLKQTSFYDPLLYDAALLLWFIPYICVRFSSEIWGGCLFFISM